MINNVEFLNFKALRDVRLDLSRFTALVGANGSGKTSVLQGLSYLADAEECSKPAEIFGGVDNALTLLSAGSGGEMVLMCDDDRGWVRIWKDSETAFEPPTGSVNRNTQDCPVRETDTVVRLGNWRGGEHCASSQGIARLGPAILLRLDTNQIVIPSYSDKPIPRISSDGAGLATVLAYMASNQPDEFARLLEALQSVIPFVHNIRFPRAKVVRPESETITIDDKTFTRQTERVYWGNSIEFDFEGASRIPAHMVSEGTLLVLALVTVLMSPSRPRLLLLDDIDRALHPRAQKDLIGLLRTLLDRDPELQIVATSHSPYLLDQLAPDEIRLTTLRDDGSVACARLDQHPDFEKWRETMAPGEFWSFVGEQWVVEVAG